MSENQNKPDVGRVPSRGETAPRALNAGCGYSAENTTRPAGVGRVPPHGAPVPPPDEPPRRLRRLHRVWPDRDGNISYLLTMCVDGRVRILDNEDTFQRLVSFLLHTPQCYHWFGRRFVFMPDHLHPLAPMHYDPAPL